MPNDAIIPITAEDDLRNAWESLTNREIQVAIAIANGATNRDIAALLGFSLKTYDTHRGHVLEKLRARHNVDVCRIAAQLGKIRLQAFALTGN